MIFGQEFHGEGHQFLSSEQDCGFLSLSHSAGPSSVRRSSGTGASREAMVTNEVKLLEIAQLNLYADDSQGM